METKSTFTTAARLRIAAGLPRLAMGSSLRQGDNKHRFNLMMKNPAIPILGDVDLDENHTQLLRLILALLDATEDDFRPALNGLHIEIQEHFRLEDEDLRTMGGNNANCHLNEHAAVLQSLDEVRELLQDSQTTAIMAQHMISSLALELLRWLPEHISEMDTGLATTRAKSRFGGSPISLQPRAQALQGHDATSSFS